MKITIDINGSGRLSEARFAKKIAQKTIESEFTGSKCAQIGLSIAFVSPAKIRQINQRYRDQDCVTDVLSFSEPDFIKRKTERKLQKNEFLGELLICFPQVKRNAKEAGLRPEQELAWVVIHGILHLLGDSHRTPGYAATMRAKEDKYLCKNRPF